MSDRNLTKARDCALLSIYEVVESCHDITSYNVMEHNYYDLAYHNNATNNDIHYNDVCNANYQQYNIIDNNVQKNNVHNDSMLGIFNNQEHVINPELSFYRNQALKKHAEKFQRFKDNIIQAKSYLKNSLRTLFSIKELLEQSNHLCQQTELLDNTEKYYQFFSQIYLDIDTATHDNGINFLNNAYHKMHVQLGAHATLTICAINIKQEIENYPYKAQRQHNNTIKIRDNIILESCHIEDFINHTIKHVDMGISVFTNDMNILNTRLEFTNHYTKELKIGARKLMQHSHTSEEAANLVTLKTKQQLSHQHVEVTVTGQNQLLCLF